MSATRPKSARMMWYGELGSGKTLCAVRAAIRFSLQHPDLPIYSNIKLNIPFLPINSASILFDINEPCFMLLDELWHLADSRKGASLINDVMNMLLLRSRKRHWKVAYTEQYYTQTDLRIRFVTDYWCEPEMRGNVCVQKFYTKMGVYLTTRAFDARKIFKYYETESDPYTLNINELKARWAKYRRDLGLE